MGKAARAIIIENSRVLVMHRNKYGSQYFTLVGGRVGDNETPEQALAREVHEETGLSITDARLVYIEEHRAPYNEQYIYLCEVAPHGEVGLRADSEEAAMNNYAMNMHQPVWVTAHAFANLPFRTPQLHEAMNKAFKKGKKGFPKKPVTL